MKIDYNIPSFWDTWLYQPGYQLPGFRYPVVKFSVSDLWSYSPVLFEGELPDDMKAVIEKWKNYIGHKEA